MNEAIGKGFTPGAVLAFGQQKQRLYCKSFGYSTLLPSPQPMQESTIFDLASLTKVLGTTLLTMKACEAGIVDLDKPLNEQIPAHFPADKAALTARHLLTHTAGFPPHVPFYRDLLPEPDDPDAQRRAVLHHARQTPLVYPPGTETRYSDLGMILLGELLEEIHGTTLDRLFEKRVGSNLPHTFFVHLDAPLTKARHPDEAFAATEECAWRQRLIRGQVHDENAYLLRGVAGHAGLFSTISDLQLLTEMLLAAAAGESDFLQDTTLKLFTRRQALIPSSSRALGWDTPSPGASCGQFFSPHAFGHTGFTGTSIWIDPEEERYVILLSNRVHPSRENTQFVRFRPPLHDLIIDVMKNS